MGGAGRDPAAGAGALVPQLAGLLRKYRALLALRESADAWVARAIYQQRGAAGARRRAALAAVAAAHPGALPELTHLGAASLSGRCQALRSELDRARRQPCLRAPARRWVAVALAYHAALRAERDAAANAVGAVGGQRGPAAVVRPAAACYTRAAAGGPSRRAWAAVAAQTRVPEATLRAWLWGADHGRRRPT